MSLLVLGASGFIGSAFLRSGSASDIFTSSRSGVPGCVPFDALRDELTVIEGLNRVSHALILFAEREPNACVANPAESARLNIEAPLRVVTQCVAHGIIPIFASTELVFDGLDGRYAESSPPRPILEYGRQKLVVERELSAMTRDHLVLRFPKTVGTRRRSVRPSASSTAARRRRASPPIGTVSIRGSRQPRWVVLHLRI